jgi:ribosome assembly protein 1
VASCKCPSICYLDLICLTKYSLRSTSENETQQASVGETLQPRDFSDKISYAFQLATTQGPLCNEPVQGIAVFLEEVSVNTSPEDELSVRDKLGRLTGEVIKTVQNSIKQGFLDWSPRLMLAMYSCEIQASSEPCFPSLSILLFIWLLLTFTTTAEVLGRVYDVLNRRGGRILSEALKEGTPLYTILSLLPVAQSFGFSDEIRKRTAGLASPQLKFEGFEILDEDPFWVPHTEEEMEDLGELADKENVAKRYVDGVRERKGLLVVGRGRGVGDGEKGKNLKR